MREREQADNAEKIERLINPRQRPKLPPLHWLRGWGKRIQMWVDDDRWGADSFDWAIIKPDRLAADAMLDFSVDFPILIDEIRRRQDYLDDAWQAALADKNDDTLHAYAEAQEVLASRIAKACEIIEKRQKEDSLPHGLTPRQKDLVNALRDLSKEDPDAWFSWDEIAIKAKCEYSTAKNNSSKLQTLNLAVKNPSGNGFRAGTEI